MAGERRESSLRSVRRRGASATLAALLAISALVPGAARARAQEVEPNPTLSMECPAGGYGILTVEWTGPFPYDVTTVSPLGRHSFKRGGENKLTVDLSGVSSASDGGRPTIDYYLSHEEVASEAEKRRKLFFQAFPEPCP